MHGRRANVFGFRRVSVLLLAASTAAAVAACAPAVVSDPATASPTPTGSGSPTPTGTATATPTPNDAPGHLRLMAANLTSGNGQDYDPGEGMRIIAGVKPDVVMIQEWNYKTNSDADLRQFVDTTLGTDYVYARETGAQIPNGVISRFPILASGTWTDPQVSNRAFEWARIDVPGPADLWAVSVHLLTSSGTDRNAEAQALVAKIHDVVPAGAFVTIAGDFNTGTRTETCVTTLGAVVSTTGPYPADRNGNTNTSENRSTPHDWVMVDSGLESHEAATVIGASTFANGLVADTRVYDPIAEIAPALAGDSGASGMQHMGVVRDFDLPGI